MLKSLFKPEMCVFSFGLVSLFRLFNAKAILLEEQ